MEQYPIMSWLVKFCGDAAEHQDKKKADEKAEEDKRKAEEEKNKPADLPDKEAEPAKQEMPGEDATNEPPACPPTEDGSLATSPSKPEASEPKDTGTPKPDKDICVGDIVLLKVTKEKANLEGFRARVLSAGARIKVIMLEGPMVDGQKTFGHASILRVVEHARGSKRDRAPGDGDAEQTPAKVSKTEGDLEGAPAVAAPMEVEGAKAEEGAKGEEPSARIGNLFGALDDM